MNPFLWIFCVLMVLFFLEHIANHYRRKQVQESPDFDQEYAAELEKVKRANRFAWIVFLCFIPWAILGGAVAKSMGYSEFAAMIPFGILYAVAGLRVSLLRCPRCKTLFFFSVSSEYCRECGWGKRSDKSKTRK